MRIDRFESFAVDLINQSSSPAVKNVSTARDAGFTKVPYGLVVEFTSGASAYVHLVMVLPPGQKLDQDEQVVEGEEPIVPLPSPDGFGSGSKIKLVDFEAWFVALLASSGSREISGLEAWTRREGGNPGRAGATVRFHSGGIIYAAVAHLLHPGASADDQNWYEPLQEA
ncbi:hypothetical protein [Streptomyces sp. NPDC002537]